MSRIPLNRSTVGLPILRGVQMCGVFCFALVRLHMLPFVASMRRFVLIG
jgi:hypothetical protein